MRPLDPRLCVLVRLGQPAAANGGATLVVADASALTPREAVGALRALKAELGGGPPLLVRSRLDLALTAELDGALLDQDDLSPADARRVLGPGALLGLMVENASQADELFRWRVDFACASGPGRLPASPPGLGRLAFRIRLAAVGTAVVAFCGSTAPVPSALVGAGADGVLLDLRDDRPEGPHPHLRARLDEALAARGRA